MSPGLPLRSPPLYWFALYVLGAFSLLTAACDTFLVSACQFENLPGCPGAPPNLSSIPPDMATPKPDEPAPLGPLRKFERRASVSLGTSRRFVGLQGSPRQAVFLATNGTMKWWEVAKLDLNNAEIANCLTVGQTCSPSERPHTDGSCRPGSASAMAAAADRDARRYPSGIVSSWWPLAISRAWSPCCARSAMWWRFRLAGGRCSIRANLSNHRSAEFV